MCEWINDVLEESFEDGSWEDAFELTLGPSGVEMPDAPDARRVRSLTGPA